MRGWLGGSSDFVLWIVVPLVLAPFILAAAVTLLWSSLVPTVGSDQVHMLPLWMPVSGTAAALLLLLAAGRRPSSPAVPGVYLGLLGLVAGILLAGARAEGLSKGMQAMLQVLLPVALAAGLPLLWGWVRGLTARRLRRTIVDPAVICIAGMRSSAEVWHGLLPLLRRLGPVKRLALPGFGTTPRPRRPMPVEEQIQWLGAEVGNRPAVIVGHSYGAHLALRYAIYDPERVQACILIAPALLRVGEGPPRPPVMAAPWLERHLLDAVAGPPGVSICLIYGERDPLVPVAAAPEAAQRLGAELHVVPGMGHLFTSHVRELRAILAPFLESLRPLPEDIATIGRRKGETDVT